MNKIVKTVLLAILAFFIIGTAAFAADNNLPSGIPLSRLEQFIDEYAAEYIGVKTAGASIAVLKDGEIVFSKAYGYAIQDKEKASVDSVFEWGSATKLLVWTSAIQLREQGKLDLNRDIREYLPDNFLKKLKYETPITMYNLMHHNAGWEDRIVDLFYKSPAAVPSLEESLRAYEPAQIFPPGNVVAYCNYGTALAGLIIERISGKPFYEYVGENIFKPLGMKDTAIHPLQADNPSIAERRGQIKGHKAGKEKPVLSKSERIFIGLYPAGSTIGTAEDAIKFLAALMPADGETSVLFKDNKTLNEMLSPTNFYQEGFPRFSHGFMEIYAASRTLGHGGNTDSFSSTFAFAPEEHCAIVVMTNQSGETEMCFGLMRALFGEYKPPAYTGELPDIKELGGAYVMARKPENGFSKLLMSIAMLFPVKSIDKNTLDIAGAKLIQTSPCIFKNLGGNKQLDIVDIIHVKTENGKATGASILITDLLPVSTGKFIILNASVILIAVCLLYTVAALIISIIGAVRNRKKGIASNLIKKLNIALYSALAAAGINNIFLVIRAVTYSTYASLTAHFAINIAYMIFAPVCVSLMLIYRKQEPAKRSSVFNAFSMASSLIFAVILLVWEVWH